MPTNHLAVAGLIFLQAAAVSRRVYASNEGILAAGLCGEESRACAATGGISDLSLVIDDLPKAKTEERWAGGKKGKRKRQVGFSHEDVAGDESLRPFVQVFRDSLSGSSKGNDLRAPQDASELLSAKDTSIPAAEEGDEFSASLSSRRSLAATRPAEDPMFFPNGGTFHDPIAVSLVSNDGAVVFYTIDGTPPDETSSFVTSSELIVLEESTAIRAIAAKGRSSFGAFSSAEVQANFVVYTAGKCGHAYFVPHFTSSGYSGNVVEVELHTRALGSVRLHGVVTDFADFYATGGVGPYNGQVVSNDLTADGNGELAGYWGGFSGDVNGEVLGFLSPLYNGEEFHGNAVQVRLSTFGVVNGTRFCGSDGVAGSNATCTFTVLDLEDVDPDLRGFSGGFLHDSKAYFVPSSNGREAGAKFVRANAGNFSSSSVEILDLHTVDPEVGGFFGGFAWEGYGYLVPCRSFQGPVGGVNTDQSADGFAWSSTFLGAGSTSSYSQRSAGRLQPAYSGKLVRVDLSDFSPSGVQVLDLTKVDPDLRGFTGGFAAGHWGFLVPFKNKEADGEYSGKMVRFDLRTFDPAGVTVLDLTRVDTSLRGFVGGFTHGRYAILSPYANGNTTGNYRGRSQFSLMVAVDLNNFSVEGVSVVDLAATSRQQIPYQPDPNLRGYVGGFSLGNHVYLTPHFNGVFFGKIARVDMREMLTMAAGERAANFDGLQVLDLELDSSNAVGFSGSFHSWETECY